MRAYIVSAGMTKIGRHFSKGFKELSLEALDKALDKAGLNGDEIDYLIVSTAFSESLIYQCDPATMIAQELGLRASRTLRVESGETSGAAAVEMGAALIRSGRAKSVAVVGFEKLSEFPSAKINTVYNYILDYEIEVIRNISPPNYAALMMKEYMKKYGISKEEIVGWSVKMHENAFSNPYAQLPFKISPEKAVQGMVISDPITLYDSFPIGDGAASIILADEGIAKKLQPEPVEVVDVEAATDIPLYMREDITELTATKAALRRLTDKYGSVLDSNTALQVHDSYSIYGHLTIEALGLAERGKAHEVIVDMPFLNIGGGLKARGHPVGATPIYQLAETYLLMTEGFSGKKYDGIYGIVHSMSGPDYNTRITLLRRWA